VLCEEDCALSKPAKGAADLPLLPKPGAPNPKPNDSAMRRWLAKKGSSNGSRRGGANAENGGPKKSSGPLKKLREAGGGAGAP
jgi:hypothetical protein